MAARCTTPVTSCSAKARSRAARSRTEARTSGTSSGSRSGIPVDRSSSTTTRSPARTMARTTCAPMYPAPPVINHVMPDSLSPRRDGPRVRRTGAEGTRRADSRMVAGPPGGRDRHMYGRWTHCRRISARKN
ncbi:protein of unknown function [Streptantibioticus cattleyicolor NRRL 8057 = DSM 46488]|nr:protein of unknown function [Streptantibioticus cattleyicolor NRRL 8057 = DSM 46488]